MAKGARLLLLEDDELLCDLLARNLEARGHEVTRANDGQMALRFLKNATFDLVLLDINLPDQTGWEVLRTARKEGWLEPHLYSAAETRGEKAEARLPVVVLSAVRVTLSRLAEFRPLAYLPKPFPMEALLHLAANAAQRRNGNGDAYPYSLSR